MIAYKYPIKLSSISLYPAIKDPNVIKNTDKTKFYLIYLEPPLIILTIKTNRIRVLLKAKNLKLI